MRCDIMMQILKRQIQYDHNNRMSRYTSRDKKPLGENVGQVTQDSFMPYNAIILKKDYLAFPYPSSS